MVLQGQESGFNSQNVDPTFLLTKGAMHHSFCCTVNEDKDLMIKHIQSSISDPNISTYNIFFCGDKLTDHQEHKLAFEVYTIAAKRNNCYGFVEIIQML